MKDLTKIMLEQLGKFITDKEKYSEYRSKGYYFEYNLDSRELIVQYCGIEYSIKITEHEDNLFWTLTPYNHSVFNTKLDLHKCNLDILLFAINDNEIYHRKKSIKIC